MKTRPAVRLSVLATLIGLAALPFAVTAQNGPSWERRQGATEVVDGPFRSTHGIDLPTAETLGGGELLFEISHRFTRPVSDGVDALWGLDGGVFLRLGLSWAPTDAVMLRVIRSNLDDNLDFGVKARLMERGGGLPFALAVRGGVALNTEVLEPGDPSTTQAHAAAILNLGLGERVALGIVPGVIVNPWVRSDGEDPSIFVGTTLRVAAADRVGLLLEYTAAPEVGDLRHDLLAAGVELETGGHFFKIVVGNGFRLNPAQAAAGSETPIAIDQLRLGFNITRILR